MGEPRGEDVGREIKYLGAAKVEFGQRLGDKWKDLADVLEISPADQRRFDHGDQPRCVWEYLEMRGRLGELTGALAYIGRPDLVSMLASHARPADEGPSPRRSGEPVDRRSEGIRLREALLDGDKPVILVHGDTGVGKSELVDFTIKRLKGEHSDDRLRIHRHQLGPRARLTTAGLIEDIEGLAPRTLRLRSGESLTARLRLALDQSHGKRFAIVVDGAQYLRDAAGPNVTLDLDEAMQVLIEHRTHHVRVVLVTTSFPESSDHTRWVSVAEKLGLSGLSSEHVITLVRELDPRDETGLGGLPDDALADLGQLLYGNPRQIKIVHALLNMGTGISLDELTEQLNLVGPAQREQRLTERLIAALRPQQRKVLEAISVFTVPIAPVVISTMLAPGLRQSEVAEITRFLTYKHLVAATDGLLFLQTGDARLVLKAATKRHDRPAVDQRELLRRAANALSDHRPADREVGSLADLDLHFEELRLWLEAGLPGLAYARIDAIDQILQRWNRGGLLLESRERVRGQLADPFREMANCNALGDIYAAQGMTREARDAFEAALDHARTCDWPEGRQKIMTNLGSLSWEDDDPVAAETSYADALAMAQERDADGDQMFALEGLANCRRWRGAYRSAFDFGRRALDAAQRIGSPNAVVIATRLSRWYTEIGEYATAEHLLTVAEEDARPHRNQALTARWLDARADLLLAQGRRAEGIEHAIGAMNAALDIGDPVTLLQARTTLGAAYLENGDAVAAAREIRAAVRYRRPGRSLIVLAFEAVLDLRDSKGEARERFGELEREAARRIGPSGHERPDFTAWDLRAVAVCGLQQVDFRATAMDYFARARCGSDVPVPGLTARLAFLLEQIERHGGGADLRSVIAAAKRPCDVQPLA